MKLTPTQSALLARTEQADLAWRAGKTTAAARARAIAEEEVSNLLAARDYAVRQAVSAGIPKNQVGTVGLHTSSPNVVYEALARTEHLAVLTVEEHRDPMEGRYTFESAPRTHGNALNTTPVHTMADGYQVDISRGILTVNLDPATNPSNAEAWEWAMAEGKWPEGTAERHPELVTARFTPAPFGGFMPLTEAWLPEHLNRHPVLVWMERDESRAEAAEWLAASAPATAEPHPVAFLSERKAA